MNNDKHKDEFSIAVDEILLKLSKKYNISIPENDYVLVQLFLNKEILQLMIQKEINSLKTENAKTIKYFRDALAIIAKRKSNSKPIEKKDNSFLLKICVGLSSLSILISSALLFLTLNGQ